MTSLAEAAQTLTALARSRSEAGRERLLGALCTLGETSGAFARPEAQAVLTDLLTALLAQAGTEERVRLAERLAHADWAPRTVMLALAGEAAEISGPVIAASAALSPPDLARIAREGGVEQALAVAARRRLPAGAVAALIERGNLPVLAVLASNPDADLGPDAMARLVTEAARSPALRAALATHPSLTPAFAVALHGSGGETLRRALERRFPDAALSDEAALSLDLVAGQRLVDKLKAAGRLGPGRLLLFLREGRLDLFQLGLAIASERSLKKVRAACADADAHALAKACRKAGLDRALLPEILARIDRLRPSTPMSVTDQG